MVYLQDLSPDARLINFAKHLAATKLAVTIHQETP